MSALSVSDCIRVLLIQAYPIMRAGLRLLLERQPGVIITGEAQHCREALALAPAAHPDIILLDATVTDERPLDQLPALLAAAEGARLLVLLRRDARELQQQVVRLGAMGIIWQDQPVTVLFRAIEKVHAGEVWIDRALVASVLMDLARGQSAPAIDREVARIALLTEREREVIGLISEGLKNKQIAERLIISETTVRHHLTSIFDKLGVTDRLELVIYAHRHKLTTVPSQPSADAPR